AAAAVRAAARVNLGDPLLFVNQGAVARRVEHLPWVEHASVHRDMPGTLRITVTEYVPTSYVRAPDGRVALIASTGRVIGIGRRVPAAAVEIRGVRVVPAVGSLLSPPESADVMRQLPARLRARVGAIDVGVFALELRGG